MSSDNPMLYRQSQTGISLQAAIDKTHALAAMKNAIGLFYSPRECAIGRLIEGGKIETLRQKKRKWTLETLSLTSVFEAQFFTPNGELRWLNTPGSDGGRTVLITDEALETSVFSEVVVEPIEAYDVIQQSYLVWGQYDSHSEQVPDDWAIVSTSQIGRLAVPIEQAAKQDFVVLKTQEYLSTDDEGNAYIKYERLLNLSWQEKKN